MSLVSCQAYADTGVPQIKPVHFSEFVFEQLREWRQSGLKTALLTLVNIEGSSPRPLGSQLGVNERGDFVGLISGGCLEAALVAEAQICIREKTVKCVRYGRDSDYFDIQLPCGSGVDILIQPLAPRDVWPEHIYTLYRSRKPFFWQYSVAEQLNTVRATNNGSCDNQRKSPQYSRTEMQSQFGLFEKAFLPRHRIVVVGEGEVFDYFVQLSQSFDFEIAAYTPKTPNAGLETTQAAKKESKGLFHCSAIGRWEPSVLDRWTSLVVLSHDHSWEHSILLQALATDVSFISALGSKNTHVKRIASLLDSGVDERRLQFIKGPAGLDIGGENPPEIALSILSQLIAKKNNKL